MQKIILIIGNIGTGKSTEAFKIINSTPNCLAVEDDKLIDMLHKKYNYDESLRNFYGDLQVKVIECILHLGYTAVVETLGHTPAERRRFVECARKARVPIKVVSMGMGSDESLFRRLKDNRGIPDSQWIKVHKKVNNEYIFPDLSEGFYSIEIKGPQFKIT